MAGKYNKLGLHISELMATAGRDPKEKAQRGTRGRKRDSSIFPDSWPINSIAIYQPNVSLQLSLTTITDVPKEPRPRSGNLSRALFPIFPKRSWRGNTNIKRWELNIPARARGNILGTMDSSAVMNPFHCACIKRI